MMKKAIILTVLASFGLIVLLNSGIFESLVLFLLAGIIPGTNYAIPSSIMLLCIVSIVWLILFRFMAIEAYIVYINKRSAKKTALHKKRMPKRRFEQV
jgi:hypothetical protein